MVRSASTASPFGRLIGSLLVVAGVGAGIGSWLWSRHASGVELAHLRVQAGTTTPLMKVEVATSDSGLVATMGPFSITPLMNPVRPILSVGRGAEPQDAQFEVSVRRGSRQPLYTTRGRVGAVRQRVPGLQRLPLDRFDVSDAGPYYLTVVIRDAGAGGWRGLPSTTISVQRNAAAVHPLTYALYAGLVVIGMALNRPTLGPLRAPDSRPPSR